MCVMCAKNASFVSFILVRKLFLVEIQIFSSHITDLPIPTTSLAQKCGNLGLHFFYRGEEILHGDAISFRLAVEESVHAVLLLSGEIVMRLEGHVPGLRVLRKLAHEVLKLRPVEFSILVRIGGSEGCGQLSHSLGLGLLGAECSSVSHQSGLLFLAKRGHPCHSLRCRCVYVHCLF